MIAWLALAALAADPVPTAATVPGPAPNPNPILDDRAYRFCHEAGVDAHEAAAYCPLLADLPPDACPGLRATCAGSPPVASGCNEAPGGPPGSQLEEGPKPQPIPPDFGCHPDLDWLEQALKWTVAVLVALAVLAIARVLFRFFGLEAPAAATLPIPVAEHAVEPAADDVPDRPSADLLAAARAALLAGRAGEAVLLARGAALRKLAERGRLVLHRSRTDREYVRSVRSDEVVHEDLRAIVRGAEAHRWAGAHIDLEIARSVLAAAERLVALGLLAVFLAHDARAADRYGPRGDAGVYDLLASRGYQVSWRTEPLAKIGSETKLLVLDLGWVEPTDEDWTALRAWVEAGGVLVVAGDATDDFPELGQLEAWDADAPALVLDGWLASSGIPAPRWPLPPFDRFTGVQGDALVTGLDPADAEGVVVEAVVGDGVVVGFADDQLFSNGALVSPRNETFLAEFFQLGQGIGGWPVPQPVPVELAMRAYGAAQGGGGGGCAPADSLANGRLLALVLQGLLLWALVALWRGWPFAVLKDPPPEARIAFSDHVEALARHLHRADARAWADRSVARLWWGRLGSAGVQAAAVRAGWSGPEARELAAKIEAVVAGGDDPPAVQALEGIVAGK